ncbi:MAG TPA: glycosyltransferase [Verrucomicrobiae bacterium]|nr:glycosyltransferase [Verrucomicrobiae bacterium]
MKVLQVGKFYDPYRGGIETVLRELCEELQSRVDLHVLVANTALRTVQERRGFPVTRVASWGTFLSSSITPSFPLWLRRLPGDILHIHLPNPVAELSYLMAARDRPAVAHFHSDIVRQRVLLRAYAPLLEIFYARVSRIVVPTPHHITVSPFLSRFREKCCVVPYGIALKRFDLTATVSRRAEELRSDIPAILFIGRLVYYKGLEYLIQAMSRVNARLWIIGTGPLEARLKQLAAQLGLQNKVLFLGNVRDEDIPAYYHASEVFVLPSVANSEMFGMVQLEAMASRKPVVATNLPTGVSYVNQDGVTGLLVPPREPAALADAINKLLGSPSMRREMGEAGRQRVEKEFTAAKMADGVLSVYRDILQRY